MIETGRAARSGDFAARFAVAYEFDVRFTDDLFDESNHTFRDALAAREPHRLHRFVVFIDDGVAEAYPELGDRIAAYARAHGANIELAAPPRRLEGGERAKNDAALVARLQRELVELGIDRHAFVVAIGGGAILDLVGYVAATTHRGVRHVRIPTTVLAQGDSGVGVKNGVNAFGVKNLLGTFAPPYAVLNDHRFIERLSARDVLAGVAEAVKVSLIRDAAFFAWIEANAGGLLDPCGDEIRYLIRRSAELHVRQITTGGDPFETGSARPLDYGHWAAHKLEILTGHALRHGEAVAIGMALDARYSARIGLLRAGDERRVCRLLRRLGFELWHPALEARAANGEYAVLAGLREFREHLGGELTITLLAGLGRGVEVGEMDVAAIVDSIAWLEGEFACASRPG